MSDKIYCGSGKIYGQYENIGLNICLTDIPAEFISTAQSGKKYVRLNLAKRQLPDKNGNTHSISVNTWKPDGNKDQEVFG